MYDDTSEIVSPQNDEEVDRYAGACPWSRHSCSKGLSVRGRAGARRRFAINKLPDSKGLRNHHRGPESTLFLDNDEIECSDWKLGDWVQCLKQSGWSSRKVMVEPYMLSRGAAKARRRS